MGNAQLLLAQLFHEINDDEHASEQLLLAKKATRQQNTPSTASTSTKRC